MAPKPYNLIAAAVASFLGIKYYQFYQKLSVSFGRYKLRINASNLNNSHIETTMYLDNKSGTQLTIKKIEGQILVGGKPLGTFRTDRPFTINASGTSSVTLYANVDNGSLAGNIWAAIINKVIPKFQYRGSVYTTFGSVPFSYTVTEGGAYE